MISVLEFLTDLEATKMQQLSRWWYQINTPRIQVTVSISNFRIFDKVYFILENTRTVLEYSQLHQKIIAQHTVISDSKNTLLP